jgi:hypothetical protein
MTNFATTPGHRMNAALLALLTIFCTGCANLASTPVAQEIAAQERERTRAERVFLYQSRVADTLLDEYPLMEIFLAADPNLIVAEARMTETCNPLTRAVLTHLEGNKPSLALRFQVFTSLNACEDAARQIADLLKSEQRLVGQLDSV